MLEGASLNIIFTLRMRTCHLSVPPTQLEVLHPPSVLLVSLTSQHLSPPVPYLRPLIGQWYHT